MATLAPDKVGVLNINLIQGDNKTITLKFEEKDNAGALTPIDLTDYSAIKLDIKSKINVTETPFISWEVGDGLTISGIDSNFLSFEFAQEFFASQRPEWYYDIKFTKDGSVSHMIKGVIKVQNVVTM